MSAVVTIRAITVRLPEEDYEAIRTIAYVLNRSLNDVVGDAVQHFLGTEGRRLQVEEALQHATSKYAGVLEKLGQE